MCPSSSVAVSEAVDEPSLRPYVLFRWFLDRVCDHTLAFEPHGVEFYEGSVSDYYAWRDARITSQT